MIFENSDMTLEEAYTLEQEVFFAETMHEITQVDKRKTAGLLMSEKLFSDQMRSGLIEVINAHNSSIDFYNDIIHYDAFDTYICYKQDLIDKGVMGNPDLLRADMEAKNEYISYELACAYGLK